jgi:hypothetical protein
MQADDLGAADGQVQPDHVWVRRLQKLIGSTLLAATALEALVPLAGFAEFSIDWEVLRYVVKEQEQLWRDEGKLGKLGLAADFMRFALAIYVYTLEDPAIYRVVQSEDVEQKVAAGGEFNVTLELEIFQQQIVKQRDEILVGRCNITFHCTPKSMVRERADKRRARMEKKAALADAARAAETDEKSA